MKYQVWTKDEYQELYTKVDCGDLPAARREIDKAVRTGQEPVLTVEVPYSIGIKIEEVGAEVPKSRKRTTKEPGKPGEEEKVEAAQSETESDQGPGDPGDGEVRPGDEADTPGLD